MKYFLLSTLVLCSNIQVILAQAPANDECNGAIAISLTTLGNTCTSSIMGNTANATQSSPNPSCTSSLNDDDIWYSFQATGSGIVLRVFDATYNVSGQTAQVGFALYGTACPVTTATLACSNFITAGSGYTAITGLIPGNTYYLRFWSASATEFASFRFCVQETNAPANDECENATPVDTEPEGTVCNAVYHASTAGASRSLPNPSCTNFNDDDIWYSFTAGANGVRLNFSNALQVLSGGNANLGYALHEAPCGGVVSCSANIGVSGGSELIGGLVPGNTYLLCLFTYAAANTYANFDFCLVDETIVVNDECTGAIELTVTNGFASELKQGSLFSATTSAGFGSPACTPPSSSDDVWFKAVVPASGNINIQTSAAISRINDLVMEAYSGDCNALSFILCADNGNPNKAPSNGHPLISLTGRVPGETIFLRVMGKGSINNGPFVIGAWDPTVLPAVAAGGNCIEANDVTINSTNGNQYSWVPVLDAAGKIAAELYTNGNSPGLINTAVFVNSSGTVRSSGGKFYLDRNLSILPADTVPLKVRLYIKAEELAALQSADPFINNEQHLQVMVTSNSCDQPRSTVVAVLYPDTVRLYNGDFYIEFETNVFGSFYIERQESVVPVRLTQYTARCSEGKVVLNWSTAFEANNAFFTVERSSDGSNFKQLATIPADDAGGGNYSYYEEEISTGKRWYRLVQTDKDGRKTFYRIIPVQCENKKDVLLFPNPAGNQLKVQLPADASVTQFKIFAADGRLMKMQNIAVGLSSTHSINISNLPDGLYILQMIKKDGSYLAEKFRKRN